MSYSFWVPPLNPDGTSTTHCTPDDFLDQATECIEAYFGTWADGAQRDASTKAAEAAVHAASMLVQSGIVGQTFRVNIYGHANSEPGKPAAGWSTDNCVINLQAVGATP